MTDRLIRWLGIASLILLIAGCKIDLYSDMPELEANQMLALLMLRDIPAEKKIVKGGNVTIRVDEKQFVNAVELLRQNGLPLKKVATMEDLFPSGQLVTSPAQEHAKITFLKEQQLEKMLRAMDGVINAQVSIAEGVSQNYRETPQPSASVFIKYSPDHNFSTRAMEIKNLVRNSIPNLSPEHISVVMQAADYRYQMLAKTAGQQQRGWLAQPRTWLAGALLGCAVLALAALMMFGRRRSAQATAS